MITVKYYNVVPVVIVMFIILLLVGFNLAYGDANFSEIIMYGKYEVGH